MRRLRAPAYAIFSPAAARGLRSLSLSMTVIAADSVTFVVGGLLYLVLLITIGIISIRKGHWVMFIIGIFFPLFWLIGALLPPTAATRA
jgi:ABC-type multidrug transport system permease subunit